MIPIEPLLLEALKSSYTQICSVQLYNGTTFIPESEEVRISSGSVKADLQQNARRTLDLTIPMTKWTNQVFLDNLNVTGSRIQVWLGYILGEEVPVMVPVGMFRVDSRDWNSSGELSISGVSLEAYVYEYTRLEEDEQPYNGMPIILSIKNLIKRAFPDAVFDIDPAFEAQYGSETLKRDPASGMSRWDLIQELAQVIQSTVFCGVTGMFKITKDTDISTAVPVWELNQGPDGVIISESTSESRASTYNGVLVMDQDSSSDMPPYMATARDIDPASPTYWGGSFGKKMLIETDQTLANAENPIEACRAKAYLLLEEYRRNEHTLDLSAVPNPMLEPGDLVRIRMLDGTYANHLITSLTIPLGLGEWTADTQALRWTAGQPPLLPPPTYDSADAVVDKIVIGGATPGTYAAAKTRWATYEVSGV